MSEHLALENITILDLTRVIAGPYCGAMLADLGANVIKIELPGRGDDARAYGPYVNGESLYYGNLNRNKKASPLTSNRPRGRKSSKSWRQRPTSCWKITARASWTSWGWGTTY